MSTIYFSIVSIAWLAVLYSVFKNRKVMFIDTFWIYLITAFMGFTIHLDELFHVRDIHNPTMWFILHILIANAFLISIRKFRRLKENHKQQQEEAARNFIRIFSEKPNINDTTITKTDTTGSSEV